jgi:hypothetical protein
MALQYWPLMQHVSAHASAGVLAQDATPTSSEGASEVLAPASIGGGLSIVV